MPKDTTNRLFWLCLIVLAWIFGLISIPLLVISPELDLAGGVIWTQLSHILQL